MVSSSIIPLYVSLTVVQFSKLLSLPIRRYTSLRFFEISVSPFRHVLGYILKQAMAASL